MALVKSVEPHRTPAPASNMLCSPLPKRCGVRETDAFFINIRLLKDPSCDAFQVHGGLQVHQCLLGCAPCPHCSLYQAHVHSAPRMHHTDTPYSLPRVCTCGPGCSHRYVCVRMLTHLCMRANSLPSLDMADPAATCTYTQIQLSPTYSSYSQGPLNILVLFLEPPPSSISGHRAIHGSLPSAAKLKSLISDTIYLPYRSPHSRPLWGP